MNESVNERLPMDPALRRFLDDQAAASAGPVQTPGDARNRMLRALESRDFTALAKGVDSADRTIEGGGGPLPIRIYTPPGPHPAPAVLVYLHGGGWVAGSIATHDPFCRLLSQLAGISIVSVEYRLAPEHPYPAALEDADAALRWTGQHAGEWGADPERLALGGDSAGGNVAAVLANRLALVHGLRLRALALLYPVTDHYSAHHGSYAENATGCGLEAAGMRWYWEQYAAGVSPEDTGISPLRASPQLFHLLPPTLITTAQYDVLRDEGAQYAWKLRNAGVAVTEIHSPDMHHDFPVSPATIARFPQSDRAIGAIAAWLRTTLRPAK